MNKHLVAFSMMATLLCFPIVCTALATAAELPAAQAGLHLTYEGTLEPAQDDNRGPKKFELQLLLLGGPERGEVAWTVSEEGRGGWSWPERFGIAPIVEAGTLAAKEQPTLLVLREDGRYIVPLELPFAALPETPAVDAEWSVGKLEAKISGEGMRGEYPCWEVDYRSPIGYKRTAYVAQGTNIVVEIKEVVFMGPGQKHVWTAKLKEASAMLPADLAPIAESFAAWQDLRSALKREARTTQSELSDEQLKLLRERLPAMTKHAAGPLTAILAAAERDAKQQNDRTQSLAQLRTAIVGKDGPQWSLKDLTGKEWKAEDLKDKPIVLHFWEYKDTPLEQPYGQVAYVDFLQRRIQDKAYVLGVHVDRRLELAETSKAAISSAKKLRDFMRLTYPILLDDGSLLKQFGDPRTVGGELPLFVVLGSDGTVTEYHAGIYPVQRERGLEELENLLTQEKK